MPRDDSAARLTEGDLEEITQRWHDGGWPKETLETVIRRVTGWSEQQFGDWVRSGRIV